MIARAERFGADRNTMTRPEKGFLSFAYLAVCAMALAFVASCKSGGVGVVGSVYESKSATERPSLLVRYDGDTFVAWASGVAYGEVYGKATGMPLYGPISVAAGKTVVHVRTSKLKWEGKVGEPLPEEARSMFRDSEIIAWGLTFGVVVPPVVGVTP